MAPKRGKQPQKPRLQEEEHENTQQPPPELSQSVPPAPAKLYTGQQLSQLFMQFFFHNQRASQTRVDNLIKAYNKHYDEYINGKEIHLQALVNSSNRKLRPTGFQIKRISDQDNEDEEDEEEPYYVLSNDISD